MPRELALYLSDILSAGEDIVSFTSGKEFAHYKADNLLRAAVERKFTVIGEALNQALAYYPELHGRINEDRDVVTFRHRVIHGYFSINDTLVWSITKVGLPELMAEVKFLIGELPL